jgi:hypothetical protein
MPADRQMNGPPAGPAIPTGAAPGQGKVVDGDALFQQLVDRVMAMLLADLRIEEERRRSRPSRALRMR